MILFFGDGTFLVLLAIPNHRTNCNSIHLYSSCQSLLLVFPEFTANSTTNQREMAITHWYYKSNKWMNCFQVSILKRFSFFDLCFLQNNFEYGRVARDVFMQALGLLLIWHYSPEQYHNQKTSFWHIPDVLR